MVSSHSECLLLPQWFVFPTRRKTKGSHIYFWKRSKKPVHLIKHIVIWRYDVKKVLDDAHIKEEGANEIELKNAGMDVVCNKEQTLQCAIIDKSIVWYGNINFFGYNSETNNVMRIADHKIANEMIEILYSDTGNDVNGG